MSTTDAIASGGGSQTMSAGDRRIAESVSGQDFLNLLVTELMHQDPLEPMDNQQLLSQLSEIRSMESSMQLTDKLTGVVMHSQMASASGMIGKYVEGKTADGVDVSGTVTAVQIEDDTVKLRLGQTTMPFEGVFRVMEAPPATDAALQTGGASSEG